jgi:alkanesulfonate monooxygenase SsuD/methylene tetrahydromethanopterin reductase-like flavin-dependent oxidoreductase (luciferase family)
VERDQHVRLACSCKEQGSGYDLDFARELESLGVDATGFGEAPRQFSDPYVGMALVANATTRLRLITCVTHPGVHHPAAQANAFMTVQELSGGRAVCGIGTGDVGLTTIGLKPYKTDSFLEYTMALKSLMAGETVNWKGAEFDMRLPMKQRVPVFFGADGPRMMNAAGRLADGLIVAQLGSADVVRTTIERAAAGAAEAGRSVDELEIWFMLRVLVTERENGVGYIDGLDEYVTRALRLLARTAGARDAEHMAAAIKERRGMVVDEDVGERLWHYNQEYDESQAWVNKHNVELMDKYGLRDFGSRYFYASGSPEHIRERVKEFIDAGARNFFMVTTPAFIPSDWRQEQREMLKILEPLR